LEPLFELLFELLFDPLADFFHAIQSSVIHRAPKVCTATGGSWICADKLNMLIKFPHLYFSLIPQDLSIVALSREEIRSCAERLDRAERTRTQIRQLSLEYPGITVEDAYAIQKEWVEIKVAAGRIVKGHKIGLTSKAMQSALNIDEPDSGILLDDMFFADGGLVPSDRFIATRVEAELAFIMEKRLMGPGCTMFDVLKATDFVVPALEILDTRIERVDAATKSTRKIFDTIADNAANAGIVLGGRPIRPLDADLRWVGALCFRNGQLEETGLAAGVLNHPATGVAWLANKIASHGLALEPGQVVLAGSFIRPIETRKGDTIQADYGPYGSVSCYFA
jgi:2-oxo-hept-3-ene-1,7-dioate hydratase